MCISRRNRRAKVFSPEKKAESEVEDVMFFDMDDDEAEGGFPGFFGGGGGGGLLNLLRGEMGGGSRRTNRKCPNTEYPLKVSLEDLYRGRVAKLKLTKKTPCTRCDGSGGAKGASYKCQSCRGHGRRMVLRRVGPMMAQTEAECEDCDGRGERIPAKELCPKCTGEGVTKEQKALQAEVERGMVDGDVIIFKGEGDQLKVSSEPGDVVVHLIVKDHDVFTRRGDHLIIEKEISLNEALCGFQMQLEHLDGRSLVLKSKPGDIIKPNSIRGILNGGMPRRKNPTTNGNLYVKFEVKFPEPHFLADEEKYKVLATALPKAKKQRPVPEDAEEVSLMEYDAKKYDRRGDQAYDEDDDDEEEAGGSGGRPGQCAQQ